MSTQSHEAAGDLAVRANIFAALGDRTRLGLVGRLSDGKPRSISRLVHDFSLTRQAVTKHLRVLENAGLVRSERVGRERRFGLCPETLADTQAYLARVTEQWDATLMRLKHFVED